MATSDRFSDVRKQLRLAASALTDSEPRTTRHKQCVNTIKQRLDPDARGDYDGDHQQAHDDLGNIVTALRGLKRPRKATDTGRGKKLKQDGKPMLLPGVADAIDRLNKAIELLTP